MRPAGVLFVAVLGLVAATGCGAPPENLLLISVDTTRADHVGAYGNPLGLTPNLDSLAARGVLFENAYAPMPQTLPTHATLFTGLEPRTHGALENAYVVDDDLETLAETLSAAGYRTAGVIAALVLSPATGIDQGFDFFDRPDRALHREVKRVVQRRARFVTDAALGWADTHERTEPYFLWAHYYDPHDPFDPTQQDLGAIDRDAHRAWMESRRRELRSKRVKRHRIRRTWRRYAAEVRGMDREIGRLLDGLDQRGLLERTLVVVVGDHGEGLYEHGLKGHGLAVFEEQMRVPLIVAQPGGEGAARRVAVPVALSDVAPTLHERLLGRPMAGPTDGRSLAALLRGDPEPEARAVFVERPHHSEERQRERGARHYAQGVLAAVVDGGFKLIRHPGRADRLYDLGADPEEVRDLAPQEGEVRERLAGALDAWLAAHPVSDADDAPRVSEEQLEALRALGYLDVEEE